MKNKKLIIFGTGQFAEFTAYHFTHQSDYEVVAFTIEKEFYDKDNVLGKPIILFEEIEKHYHPEEYEMFIAIGFHNMNRVRENKMLLARKKGYKLASYVSPTAKYFTDSPLLENVFIDDYVIIQPFVKLGEGVIIWAGSIVAHHSQVGNYVLIAPGAKIAGRCIIEDYSFIGVNASLGHGSYIRKGTLVGAGCTITKETEEWKTYIAPKPIISSKKSFEYL